MISVTVDIVSPSIDIVKDHANDGMKCALMRILNGDGSQFVMHFDKEEDIAAFIGLQLIASGVKLDVKTDTSRT